MLKVENLCSFYQELQVLYNVSFEVKEGELVTIIGPNGAGKTTALKSIVGLVKKKGQVLFDNKDISRLPCHSIIKLGLALVPEGRHVFPYLTVKENLDLGAFILLRARRKKEYKENLEFVFSLFPILKERLNQPAQTMSGGEQQMLAIGRALMSSPRIILLDEPSMGLAPKVVKEIFKVLKKLKEDGKTILIVEQNARLVLSLADRGYLFQAGQVVLSGSTDQLKTDDVVKKAYFGKEVRLWKT